MRWSVQALSLLLLQRNVAGVWRGLVWCVCGVVQESVYTARWLRLCACGEVEERRSGGAEERRSGGAGVRCRGGALEVVDAARGESRVTVRACGG